MSQAESDKMAIRLARAYSVVDQLTPMDQSQPERL